MSAAEPVGAEAGAQVGARAGRGRWVQIRATVRTALAVVATAAMAATVWPAAAQAATPAGGAGTRRCPTAV